MKIVHSMHITDVPGASLIEPAENGKSVLIHYHSQNAPQLYSLEGLIIFRNALTVMIQHLQPDVDQPDSAPGPDKVKDKAGDWWHRRLNGEYSRNGQEDTWPLAVIREAYGIAVDQS